MKPTQSTWIAAACGILCALPFAAKADTSFTLTNTTQDAFLCANLPSTNFGSAGTLAIASVSSPKGGFDSVLMFNTASAVSQFNTTYGAGNWTITGFTLSLASNFGTNGAKPNNGNLNIVKGGNFGIDWLANNSWVEGTGGGNGTQGYPFNSMVSFDSISNLFSGGYDSLGTNTYTPPGNNVYANYSLPLDANLVAGAAAGGNVSLYFYAADNQVSYLFNSREFGSDMPELTLTAAAVPEPATAALLAASLSVVLFSRRQRRKK
jgi:hypothetical protein